MMKKIVVYLKKEKVMSLSLILAIVSACFIHPDKQYIEYIDLRTLALLFCLMVTVKGFQNIGLFDKLAEMLFAKVKGSRSLIQILVGLCFFSSMLITNDVALITFVPFAILALKKANMEKHMILTVVLQTIAANLGSMLTPIGNPQNLYLFGISELGIGEFFGITTPITVISLVMLFVATLFIKNLSLSKCLNESTKEARKVNDTKEIVGYILLFLLDLFVVFRVISWWVALVTTIFVVLLMKRQKLLVQADYALLITFVGFFIFVGNIGRIPAISEAIEGLITGREILVSSLFSQVMSNVPAALLLAGFTENIKALIVGTNIGGLGTLIASMASLISYKIYAETEGAKKAKYIGVFTLYNIAGLVLLLMFSLVFYK